MIQVTKLHTLFYQRYNRGTSNFYQDFNPWEIDQFFHDAVRIMTERMHPLEGDVQKVDFTGFLTVTSPERQPLIVPTKVAEGKYEIKVSDLTYSYLHYKRISIDQGCGFFGVSMEGLGRLNDINKDSLMKPSMKWERAYGYVAKDAGSNKSIFIHCEPGTEIKFVQLDYVIEPKPVFFGGYDTIEYLTCVSRGSENCNQYKSASSDPQDLEMDAAYASMVVDYAVAEAKRTIQDVQGFELSSEKLTRTTT